MSLVAVIARDDPQRETAAAALSAAPPEWEVVLVADPVPAADVVVGLTEEPSVDIVLDPHSPQETLERIRRHLAPAGRRVVVTGAPGSGVTSLALHLAAFATGAVAVCCDPLGGLRDRVGGAPQVRVASMDEGYPPEGAAHVVFDAPARGVVPAGDVTLFVLPATQTAVRRAVAVFDELDREVGLVVNRLGRGGEITASAVGRALGCPVVCELPHCPPLRDAEDRNATLRPVVWRWPRRVAGLTRALGIA